ncbi:MAG: 4-hydroxybenzoate octaprenyltransferase [SAR86 cluster bacterium]|jgi:4-hydroxybenzoate polyprenyltransferase|nr:4-hydroxybenzoate octaprenyltransferase [SAR86 cluster bacterium]|tara:strand:+ start:175 stop:1062 length:888 start_codon:yes stop_codon:yes gene_type:complete
MSKIKSIISITRLNKPIGIYLLLYPSLISFTFAYQDYLNGSSGQLIEIPSYPLLIIICGCILVRSTGCVINDIFDYKFDKLVERTKDRPLANGNFSLKEAWLLFIFLGILSILLLFQTNAQTILIGFLTSLLIVLYPLTKRFLLGPQFFLAVTFSACVPIVFSMLGQLDNSTALLLYIGNAAWIISYDTYYAMGDADDDIKIGINSTPLWWKDKTIFLINMFKIIFLICLILIGLIKSFTPVWFIGLIGISFFFFHQNKLASNRKFLEAFKNNNYVGLALFILLQVELILSGIKF